MDTPDAPSLLHLFTLEAELSSTLDAGEGPLGRRVLNAVSRGTFSGPRMKGTLHPGTGDWMLTRGGIHIVDARLVLLTDDGARIHMTYGGRIRFDSDVVPLLRDPERRHLIDPGRYYFRTQPVFETGSPDHAWLNGVIALGTGRLTPRGVAYEVFEVQ